MQQFLINLFESFYECNRRRSARRPQRPVRLAVEALEDRLVPATVVPQLTVLLTGPAPASPAGETSGGHVVAEPDQCVHGYKWRPRPRTAAAPSNGAVQAPGLDGVPGQQLSALPKIMADGSRLLVGGNDGPTVLVSG